MYKTVTAGIIVLCFLSCGQWKVTTLKSKKTATVKNGREAGQVFIKNDEFGIEDLTLRTGFDNDKITISDNLLKRIQVLSMDGEPELVIGNIKHIKSKDVKKVAFKFSIIGSFALDNDGNLYVQNRFPQLKRNRWIKEREELEYSPSYVLVFNEDGKLQYTLGQGGPPDIPFYHIEKLVIDSSGRLFVISRSYDVWSVLRFKGKKRDFHLKLSKLKFEEKEDDEVYNGKIENVKVYNSGEKFLISVAYYHGLRLKYRKVYVYSIEENKIVRTVLHIPDAKNVLLNIVDDKHIYFWNMDNSDVKFMICSLQGNIINNVLLKIQKKKSYYTRVVCEKSGDIFSYHITRNGIDIYEWE